MGPPKTATSGRMYAQSSEKKMSHARIGFALLCGLAVCCSVMYITADAGEVYVHEEITSNLFGGSKEVVDAGDSVGSTDVLKAGQIYTETPDGRMRLMDYFNGVERRISDEVANRKADIASVRAQMARDFAFNAAARAKLKRQMLHKMAVNAKKCRDDLNDAMRKTQERFAKQARLANRRYRATLRRDRRTVKMAAHDRREEAHNLRMAVKGWQTATSAWASATNARIDRMNKHVAANAAQIKENAKKARRDLEGAMHSWDHKIANFRRDSKAARSSLSAQFAAQDKATRAWANNKIKALVASTAAQFNDVETKMAKNRHEIDMALKQATMRFEAALNAQKALEAHRYAETVRNIAAAKADAKKKVAAAKTEFKVGLLQLSSTVKEQVTKVNNRIDHTAGVVRSNRAAQAKVNANVNAEMGRMIKLGNKRYKKHLHDDVELHKGTSAVWAALWKNQEMQRKKNAAMAAATRRMRLDAIDQVRKTKAMFRAKIHKLGVTVRKNDKKADKQIEKLSGVVKANAAKSARGRKEIAALEDANKNELHHAIRQAIEKGEKRAQLVEKRGAKMDKDTRWLLNNKLNTEISKLRSETNACVEALALQSKSARAEMKKEMLYAIRSAAAVARSDLKIAIRESIKKMAAFSKKSAKSHAKSALARKALKARIARNAKSVSHMIRDAVATDARARLALKAETAKAIKKTNTRVDAYAARMRTQAKKARAEIAATAAATINKVKAEEARTQKAVAAHNAKDVARQKAALKFASQSLKLAEKEASDKFGKAYMHLAANRAHFDKSLGAATAGLNDALAKQAALADSRFSKTVKDLSSARKQATKQVQQLRKNFSTQMATVTAHVKNVETRLVGEIAVVSGEVISDRANLIRVNRRVSAELKRIIKVSDQRFSRSKRARGKLKLLMDENKAAASAEVKSLAVNLKHKLIRARAKNAHNRRAMAKDLSKVTKSLYQRMSAMQKRQHAAASALSKATAAHSIASANALKRAKRAFASKISMLTNTVAANAKKAENSLQRVTGVVHNIAKASKADRKLIKDQISALEADLNKSVVRAIAIGEARAKAVEQRLNEHLKKTKRYLQTELSEGIDRAADNVFKIVNGKRQKVADNYLSLKAYAA